MDQEARILDPRRLGAFLADARAEAALSQAALAARCGLAQQQISYFEAGARTPTLEQALRIARALDLPLQRLLSGSDRPGAAPEGLVIEFRRLGIVDLRVRDAAVPGSFRRPEEVLNLALTGAAPDPRVVEAIPAALAWADLDPDLLAGHAAAAGTARRLAWLADAALAIDRRAGFPGGCRKGPLERFLRVIELPGEAEPWDDLGAPAASPPASPIWRRWRIAYDADLDRLRDRAEHLHGLRSRPAGPRLRPPRGGRAVRPWASPPLHAAGGPPMIDEEVLAFLRAIDDDLAHTTPPRARLSTCTCSAARHWSSASASGS